MKMVLLYDSASVGGPRRISSEQGGARILVMVSRPTVFF